MTTRVKISHLGGNKKVSVKISNSYGSNAVTTLHKTGDYTEAYVHNAQHVTVEELDQDVDVEVPAAEAEEAAEEAPVEGSSNAEMQLPDNADIQSPPAA